MMQRLKLPQYLRWCVMHLTLTLAFAPAAMALQLPRQHCDPCTHTQQWWRYPKPKKDKTDEAKIIEKQLDRLIRSKKGMLVFRSQADLARAFDLMANYPSTTMTSTANSPQSRMPPVIAYLKKENKGFKSLYGAPFGLPTGWHSYPLLAALLNKDQAVIVRDDIYAFNGPEELYRLPERKRRSYKIIHNRRFSENLPPGSAFYQLDNEQEPKDAPSSAKGGGDLDQPATKPTATVGETNTKEKQVATSDAQDRDRKETPTLAKAKRNDQRKQMKKGNGIGKTKSSVAKWMSFFLTFSLGAVSGIIALLLLV